MEEKKIKEIFAKYLLNLGENGVELAVAAALCEAAKMSLCSLLKSEQIEERHLAIMELAIEARSGLCVETFINRGEITALVPGGSPEAFLDIYNKFDAIIKYLDINLENLKFGPLLSKEAVRENLNQLSAIVNSRHEQLKSDGGGVSNADETRNLSYLLNVAMQLILGEEIFGKFGTGIESIKIVLEKMKGELVIPKSGNVRNQPKPN